MTPAERPDRTEMLMFDFTLERWVRDRDAGVADPDEWGGVGWTDGAEHAPQVFRPMEVGTI